MSKLTIAEKGHWKERVERRINEAIGKMLLEHPNLVPEVEKQAKRKAVMSLGLTELHDEYEQVVAELESLNQRKDSLESELYKKATGETTTVWGNYDTVVGMIQSKQKSFEDYLLADSIAGKQLLKLRREKEEFMAAVWLATSNRQIIEIWGRVAQVLGDDALKHSDILQDSDA